MVSQLQYRDPRNLRKLDNDKLLEVLNLINNELAVFRSGINNQKLPHGKTAGTVSWGLCKQLKHGKARILTILNERGIKVY
jgi:hypothetical protein